MAILNISGTSMDKVLASIVTGYLKVKMFLLKWEDYSDIEICGILANAGS